MWSEEQGHLRLQRRLGPESRGDGCLRSFCTSVPVGAALGRVVSVFYTLMIHNKNICSLQKISLDSSSEEYRKVCDLFNHTLPLYCVEKIERIQNLALWEVYQWYVGAHSWQAGDCPLRPVHRRLAADLLCPGLQGQSRRAATACQAAGIRSRVPAFLAISSSL